MAKQSKIYIALSFLLSALSLFAQTHPTVSGTVKDNAGVPIAQALVAIRNTTMGALTDSDGRYTFSVRRGKQLLVVSSPGYNTIVKEIDMEGAETFDFVLHENSVSLDAVQVLGKSNSEQMREKIFSATNIDVQPIAASLNNLNRLVNRASGIHIRQEGGVGSDFNLSINGLSGNTVRYFIDGIPLSALGSGISLANLPINIVDRIEIYKGVVPADLGEDALGGAINIITRRNRENFMDFSLGGGSFHTYKADFNAQYIHKKTGFTIRPSLGFSYSKNDYIMRNVEVWDKASRQYRPMNKRRFHDGYQSAFARLEAGFLRRPWADEMLVSTTFSTEKRELQTGQKQTIVIGNATRNVKSLNLSARYLKRDFLMEKLTARAFFSYTANHTLITDTAYRAYAWDGTWAATSFSEVTGRGKSIRHYQRPQTIVRTNFNYFIDENSSLNLNYLMNSTGNKRYDDFDSQFIPTNDRMDKHIIGLSYNRRFWNDKLNTSVFVKDYIFHSELKQQELYWITGINDVAPSATRNNTGFGFGGRYRLSPALALKTSYERSVRLPVSREFLGNGETIYPNFKLKPELAHNINIGLFGEWKQDKRHAVHYETNFFVRKVQDYILRLPLGDRQSQYANVAAATVQGVEGAISYEFNGVFRAAINGTYLNERNKNRVDLHNRLNPTYNNRMPNRPWLYSNVELGWSKKKPFGIKGSQLKIDYLFRYTHWFYLTWEAFGSKESKEVIPIQLSNDISVTWLFNNRYSLSAECSNLLNHTLYDNYMLQKPGRAFFGKFSVFIN